MNIFKSLLIEKLNDIREAFSGVDKTISLYPFDITGVRINNIKTFERDFKNGLKPKDNLLFCQRYIIGKGIIKAKLNFVAIAKPKK